MSEKIDGLRNCSGLKETEEAGQLNAACDPELDFRLRPGACGSGSNSCGNLETSPTEVFVPLAYFP